jgi:protein-L-isoaspartate(D-aspartate) O-methyltransferase
MRIALLCGMAWACSGATNDALVRNLVSSKLLTHGSAIRAMEAVDRFLFVTCEYAAAAYEDRPLPIGYDVTISAPHMHAMMLDLMAPRISPGSRALDVGSGSGYIVACMAKMGARAYGIEHIAPLVERSIKAVAKVVGPDQFEIIHGDGRLGWPKYAPFDVIHVGAAAQPEVVGELMKQLTPKGILIIPVQEDDPFAQSLYTYEFDEVRKVRRKLICGVRFVPLTSAPRI